MEEDKRQVFTAFVYPMIGLCGLSVLIGSLLVMGWSGPESFQYAMTRCCAVAVALFGGYFLAAYLVYKLGANWFKLTADLPAIQQFAGYALVMVFLLNIVLGILPDFQIIAIVLQFYTLYIVWEGCCKLLDVQEEDRFRFTLFMSLLLIFCPVLIEQLFTRLMILLN